MLDRARILVVEDEPDIAGLIAYGLTTAGYQVETVGDGTTAADTILRERPDLVVLDLMLPGRSGLELLAEIRKSDGPEAVVPVLILTAKRTEDDRITGLEYGADDYLTKPFSPRELVLRVEAILRRAKALPLEGPGRILHGGPIRVELDSHTVRVEDETISLTPTEYRLLTVLLERRGRVQSRHSLLRTVWDIDAEIETRTVDTHILRLRRKLRDAGEWIETVRGYGYRFRHEDRLSTPSPR